MSTKITGVLLENGSDKFLSGLYAEVYTKDKSTWLGGSKTDRNGRFSFYVREDVPEWSFPLTLVVYRNDIPYYTQELTSYAPSYSIALSALNERAEDITHEVTDQDRDYFIVYGKLTDKLNGPMPSVTLSIYASGFRVKSLITKIDTDANGNYFAKIARASLNINADDSRGILIQAIDAEDTIYATSGSISDIPLKLEVNLLATGDAAGTVTEYEQLSTAISALIGAASFSDITVSGEDRESMYLSKVSGFEEPLIRSLVAASSFAAEIGDNEGEIALYTKLFYALLRSGVASDRNALFQLKSSVILGIFEAAAGKNIIETISSELSTPFIEELKDLIISEAKSITVSDEEISLNTAFSTVFSGGEYLDLLLRKTAEFEGNNIQDFWTFFRETESDSATSAIQKGIHLLAITGFQPEIAAYLFNTENDVPENIHGLAEWTTSDWEEMISTVSSAVGRACVPNAIPDANTSVYAQKLQEITQDMYPAIALKAAVEADAEGMLDQVEAVDDVVAFLSSNPTFDFRIHSVHDVESFDTEGVSSIDTLKSALAPLQRLSRIVDAKPAAIAALKTAGHSSAQSIISGYTASQFTSQYASVMGGAANAASAYNLAAQISWTASQATVSIAQSTKFNNDDMAWYKDPISPSASPELATMFGSMEQCGCEYCMSVYSASAYYVDLLHFIEKHSLTGTIKPAFTELIRRRPDLLHIDLTCKNANTPVPYIDIVNELLEKEITGTLPNSYQTSGKEAELAAYPEHTYKDTSVSPAVYTSDTAYTSVYDTTLKNAIYPGILPFNFAMEEARIYLSHLGYSRYDLLRLFKPHSATYDSNILNYVTEYNELNEYLGISRKEADIICKQDTQSSNVYKYYGFSTISPSMISPSDTSVDLSGNWLDLLSGEVTDGGIDVLIHQLKISYKELLQLLTTDFLNPKVSGQRLVVLENKPGFHVDTCVLKELRLVFDVSVDKTLFYDKMHRFVRLQRAAGISIYELDVVLMSVLDVASATDIDYDVYKMLVKAIRFSNTLKIQPEKMATWWSDMSTHHYLNYGSERQDEIPSLYDRLFRSKSVKNPPDPAFDNSTSITGSYTEHASAIIAACGIKEEELQLLLTYYSPTLTPSATVDVAGLSLIFREAIVAQALGLRIEDYIRFCTLTGFTPGSITDRFALLEAITSAATFFSITRFSLDELDYVLNYNDDTFQFTATDEEKDRFYGTLDTELNKIRDSVKAMDQQGKMLKAALKQQYVAAFAIDAEVADYLLSGMHVSSDSALDLFTEEGYIVTGNMAILKKAYDIASHTSFLVNRLKLKATELKALQEAYSEIGGLQISMDLAASLVTNGYAAFESYLYWILFRDRFGLLPDDFEAIIQGATHTNSLTKEDLFDKLVAVISGWNEEGLEELLGDKAITTDNGQLEVEYGTDGYDQLSGALLMTVADIFAACDKIGITPAELRSTSNSIIWANIETLDSAKIVKAARAKYDEPTWLKLAKPLRDSLREKQRRALVAYLVANPDPTNNKRWRNENDLYAHLLIDVEMSACMKTSRIKQAISSAQLFMDRVILNLEYENGDVNTSNLIALEPSTIEEWKEWRKWYRIWEANRKIFLYPENWIEPELRDDKTPFFEELETRLLQDEVTAELVEDAYFDYLEKLDGVSRLQPVTNYRQYEPENKIDIIHAFARTHAEPHIYYYRKLENEEWTPWEKINLDIKGDHVTAVMWNRRLYLFWLTFTEKAFREEEVVKPNLMDSDTWMYEQFAALSPYTGVSSNYKNYEKGYNKYWNVYLNWSEFKDNKWQPTKISEEAMELIPANVHIPWEASQSIYTRYTTPLATSPVITEYEWLMDFLTKQKEIGIHEVFRNRLRLFANVESDDTLALNLQFTSGLDELFVGLHAFRFTDRNTAPVVLRNSDRGYRMVAPTATLVQGNWFVESPVKELTATYDNRLYVDTLDSEPRPYFMYAWKSFTSPYGMPHRAKADAILNKTPFGDYKLAVKANYMENSQENPMDNHFFYEDERNTYFVRRKDIPLLIRAWNNPENVSVSLIGDVYGAKYKDTATSVFNTTWDDLQISKVFSSDSVIVEPSLKGSTQSKYYFQTFYHPHIHNFVKELSKDGLDGLLQLSMQVKGDTMDFHGNYDPTLLVANTDPYWYPTDIVDFSFGASYSIYNWELFFHIPMLVAQRLSNNMQFEEAQKWYHYVFNPTSNADENGQYTGDKTRFWRFRPFYKEAGETIVTLTQVLQNINQYHDQVVKWEQNPFKPHVIARMRLMAYMKNAVMKYLDNLIAWGDQLFRNDTIESINEATQLYILAANILGERPQQIPPRALSDTYTYDQLPTLDDFSNAMVTIETFIDPSSFPAGTGSGAGAPYMMQYFCLPNNEKLLGYWDTIADRLFKIRNCRNIEGVLRQLPLYEPPIDPALLVKAAAAGVDTASLMSDFNATLPKYRFSYTLQKANELCADVRGLGSAILSALEKKDAEALSLLRSSQELKLLEKVRQVKEAQVNEAEESLNALQLTRNVTEIRYQYYSSRPYTNASEQEYLKRLQDGIVLQGIQSGLEGLAGIFSAIPQFHAQAIAAIGTSSGGQQFAALTHSTSATVGIASMINSYKSNMASVKAGYERRQDDWTFQADSAKKELEQIDKQILAAQIRLSIAERELANHDLQMQNSKETDDYMRNKFTNQELYGWMTSQLATVYFQSYQLAYDLAKKAEQCYHYELPLEEQDTYIKFGYWDSLKKGLLAGEKLQFDLRKMEVAYMDKNTRELELTKHISLALLQPQQLLDLRANGTCSFDIPEELFDLDYPGHYLRRIKSVSMSIPCVAGPYTTISATLVQDNWKYRNTTDLSGGYAEIPSPLDERFERSSGTKQSIATSMAQNDSGVFELNFRDERYIPFEGTGAISSWTIEMPDTYRMFDYNTISDVILHIKYTAREGDLKSVATTHLTDLLASTSNELLPRYFSLKHEFAQSWHAYTQTAGDDEAPANKLGIILNKQQYPFFCQDRTIKLNKLFFWLKPKQPFNVSPADTVTLYVYDSAGSDLDNCTISVTGTDINTGSCTLSPAKTFDTATTVTLQFKLEVNGAFVNINDVLDDIYLVTKYTLS